MRLGAWRWLLALLGARRRSSYVDVDDETLTIRFGGLEAVIPRSDVVSAVRTRWPAIGGIGWRIGRSSLGLIGSLEGVVELGLGVKHKARVALIPMSYDRLFVSLEDPDGFVAALALPR